MGRFSASDARPHELRQPKPANAAFRQCQPPQSHGSSLGLEHPQSAIPPACREEPALGVIGQPPVPPAQREPEPPQRVRTRRGAQGERSPPPPLGTPPAACPLKAPRGCCPGRAAARRTRNIPTEFRATSARLRQFGGDAGPRGPSRIRRSAPRPGHIGRQAEQGGLASATDQGTQAKALQRCKASRKLLREQRTRAGRSRRACGTPAAALVQKASKTAMGRAAAPTQVHGAQCGTGEAPQERRRGCTRTPRRRRRSGWTRP